MVRFWVTGDPSALRSRPWYTRRDGTPLANEADETSRAAARTRTEKLMSAPFHLRRDAIERPVRGRCSVAGKLGGPDAANQLVGAGMHQAAAARERPGYVNRGAAHVRVARLPAAPVGSAL